jgi:cell division protein FtsI/penicillin-binding protein 2/cell division protein FtsW (lipid II flippase)
MAVTRSWATQPAFLAVKTTVKPRAGLVTLLCASVFVAAGLFLAYAGKTQGIAAEHAANLNTIGSSDELMPLLESFADRGERQKVADAVFDFLARRRPLPNVGALAPLRRSERLSLGRIKPLVIVRTPAEYRAEFLKNVALYFGAFYFVAAVWALTRFGGDRAILPALHLLTGMGLILMVSLRDPLRDTLEFHKFAVGVAIGCLMLALPAIRAFDYMRLSDWCYTPLFLAMALFGALVTFGKGPAGVDAKVNLGPFQPVEFIKILLVLFLAGYFTRNWERLRDLREKRFFPQFFRRIGLPRLEHVAPVLFAVAISLVLFFVLKDLGPALVTFFVFLAMFAVARGRPGLAFAGLALMIASVAIGYKTGQPQTVVKRIDMWLSPWNNDVRGGDQLAHSLWAFATGGPTGSGPGWGDPSMIPAGHTDLVLAAIGEDWGFVGVVAVFLLSGFLVARAYRAAARSDTRYGSYLAVGLGTLIGVEMLLISAGVLGVLPLSGVVSPFLSSGNTAMLANFLVMAMVLSVSADRSGEPAPPRRIRYAAPPALPITLGAAAAILLGFAAHYQLQRDRDYLAKDAYAFDEDGVKRPQHNPRLNSVAREIPRGNIYDRNGVLVATSSWAEVQRRRGGYEALGVPVDRAVSRFDSRHYPFGAVTAHLVGDLRTGENFFASNASLVEHDANPKLQGYRYAELASLVRYRHQPNNPALAAVLARDRDVHLTIDIRLQLQAQEILERKLREAGAHKGSVVVMNAATGDVLAMASAPSPDPPGSRTSPPTPDDLLDRARYGQYPPGSTFKLVTAIAALRLDTGLRHRTFLCRTLPDGRAGNTIAGWNRPIKDDIGDHAHGTVDMERAIAVSCNAYFAQLGVNGVGSKALAETAERMGIATGEPAELRKSLPFSSYGQGEVLVTPFKMARVAATIAAGGRMPQGRWTTDDSNTRTEPSVEMLPAGEASFLAGAMRRVVTEGTARRAMTGSEVSFAGKTGTAQLDSGLPHSWFTGFAPYDGDPSKRMAFAVIVEHGGYGARVAAPIAREVMEAAKQAGLL